MARLTKPSTTKERPAMRKLPIMEERIDVDGPRGQKPANLRIVMWRKQ